MPIPSSPLPDSDDPVDGQSLLPWAESGCGWVHATAALVALILGVGTIVVWINPAYFTALNPGLLLMRLNTAVAMSAAGLSLGLFYRAVPGSNRERLAKAFAVFVVLVGGLTAAEDIFAVDLGIDLCFGGGTFAGDLASPLVRHIGRMSLNASLSFFCLGMAMVGLDASIRIPGRRPIYTAPLFTLLGALPTASALVGYLMGTQAFTGFLQSTTMLLHTAAGLMFLAAGIWATRPHRAPLSGVLSSGTGGFLLRWLTPGAAVLLLLQGWLITMGRNRGLVAPDEGTALMLYGSLVLLSYLILLASRAVAAQEAKARHAELAYRAQLVQAKDDAERANQAKDHFLAALSHELRTPLTPVLLSTTALRLDTRLPEDVHADLAMVERNVRLEARLIDDLLDLTRIAHGKLQLNNELCDVHSLLGHAIEIVRDDAHDKHIQIVVDLKAKFSSLSCDPARLQQVFWNVLKNAVKFTPGGGHIQVSTADSDSEGCLRVEVTDTGVGFVPETSERLFLAFEQGNFDTTRRFGGLGLGLSIVRAIVDLHGGVVSAKSAGIGHGAAFCIQLPGALKMPSNLSVDRQPRVSDPSCMGLRILLVDDHEATLTILAKLLRRNGHEVITQGNVTQAIAAVADQARQFDVLITDLGLPDGSGHELLTELRRVDPQLQGIALSGFGLQKDLERSKELGFRAHLVKPVLFRELSAVLAELTSEIQSGMDLEPGLTRHSTPENPSS